ncbi:GNAT family N-acetyltransferase [Macrococcoides caseolyticum]|uniref:GNAT family N-acetyltransferase n=1 Tax=Macrococcoides caseolyticum TaxID=69966 RepID=UPI001F3288EA|nr:GNAT family N-acetyltransferase [Macrococcus caseolyticus]MCE4956429.1 GNAT family N-acetyltransferase [Macrococcus caseolyticus]
MTYLKLVRPTIEHKEDILKYKQEFKATKEVIHGSSSLHKFDNFDEWFEKVQHSDNLERIPHGMVPATQFLCVNAQNKIVGMVNIRHYLNDFLIQIGGHVGYSVRPDERRKGIAKWMLQESLNFLKTKDVDKALVTCDYNNIGSKKTILSCGGMYENSVHDDHDNIDVERYWINII